MNKSFILSIAGSFGYKDIGDEAMLTADLNYVLSQLGMPPEQIYLIGADPKYVSDYHEHPPENCIASPERMPVIWHWAPPAGLRGMLIGGYRRLKRELMFRQLLGVVRKSNALLVTGGGTINTRDEVGYSLKRMASIVSLYREFGVPVFLSGQTIGPLGVNDAHDTLARKLLEEVDVLTVRDSCYSRRYLGILGVSPKKFIETFDDAYTLPYESELLESPLARFLGSKLAIAVNITDYTSETAAQREFLARLTEHLIQQYDANVVFVSHSPRDFFRLNIIFDMIENSKKPRVQVPDTRLWRAEKLKRLIASCKFGIGGRYHFIVFAGTSDTPFVGMCGNHYSYIKQDGFARALGLERFILTEKETWNFEVVTKKLHEASQTKLDLKHRFPSPSVSMEAFGDWFSELPTNQSIALSGDKAGDKR